MIQFGQHSEFSTATVDDHKHRVDSCGQSVQIMQLFHITLFYLFLSLKFAKWISDVILMGICDFEHYYCTAMLNGPLTYNVLSYEY